MPANKYALLRYRIIDRAIRSKGKPFPSKDDLREACEEALYGSAGERVSASTIDKDLWAMRNEGGLGYYAPIRFSKEQGGYYYEDADYTIAEIPLNDDDLTAIRAAAQTLYQFREIPLFKQFDAAIEKIMDRMTISQADKASRASEVIQFERIGSYQGSEFLQPLFEACSEGRTVHLRYQKFGLDTLADYTIAPHILKEYRSRWYVIGTELKSGTLRTFGLDRVKGVEVDETKPSVKPNFDSAQFFKHAVGITVSGEKPEKVRLEFTERLAPYVISQPIHGTQHVVLDSEGSVVVEIEVQVSVELVSLVLGYGADVKVLSPNHLREQVKQALTDCLGEYTS